MPKRSSKNPPEDENVAAFDIVRRATEGTGDPPPPKKKKNPAAVALGRLGGKKGGPARAEKLSSKRRSEIAKEAAQARWDKQRESEDMESSA